MTLSVTKALAHITHTLDGAVSPPLNGLDILNEAGEYLATCHDWKWLERPPFPVSLVADQDYVELPDDFRDLIAYSATESLVNSLHMTTHAGLLKLRTNQIQVSSWNFWAAITHYVDATTDRGIPTPRLEFWPTPVADDTGGITIVYRAGWTELTGDEQVVPIPSFLKTLYIQLVRAFARGYEEEDSGSLPARLMEIEASPLMQSAVERDGTITPDYGPLQGGAASNPGMVRSWDYAVANPS